jgi:GT2 family glycosyltransferase
MESGMESSAVDTGPTFIANPSLSVIIVTRNRPQAMQMCLEHLERLETRPLETIVVDGSDNQDTHSTVTCFAGVRYVPFSNGNRKMCTQRNVGIQYARGDIVAFIDDDSMVHPEWSTWLVRGYVSDEVGGVGGRIIDEYELDRELSDNSRVGTMVSGSHIRIIANFGLDPGHKVAVDHLRGCNMSFRRQVLLDIGGFDPLYNGLALHDDTDICLRVKNAGYDLYFEPQAVVDHLSLRWKSYRDSRSLGLGFWFRHAISYSYLVLKNRGIGWSSVRHIFGGLLLLQWRMCLQRRRRDDWQRLVTLWPGSLIGLATVASRRRTASYMQDSGR